MTLLVPLMFQSRRPSLSCHILSYLWVCCLCCSFLSESIPFVPVHVGSSYSPILLHLFIGRVVQSLSHVQLFVTPWTAVCQVSLPFIITGSLLKLMSIELMMTSNYLIFCCPLLFLPSIFPTEVLFQWVGSLYHLFTCHIPSEVCKLVLLKNLHVFNSAPHLFAL